MLDVFEVVVWIMGAYLDSFNSAMLNLPGVLDERVATLFQWTIELWENSHTAWYGLIAVGAISQRFDTADLIRSQRISLLTAMEDKDVLDKGMAKWSAMITRVLGEPEINETKIERDLDGTLEYQSLFVQWQKHPLVQLYITSWSYTTLYTLTVFDWGEMVTGYFLAEAAKLSDRYPLAYSGDPDDFTAYDKDFMAYDQAKRYDHAIGELSLFCDSCSEVKDFEVRVPVGTKISWYLSHLDNAAHTAVTVESDSGLWYCDDTSHIVKMSEEIDNMRCSVVQEHKALEASNVTMT